MTTLLAPPHRPPDTALASYGVAAVVAVLVAAVFPLVSPLLLALLAGVAVANLGSGGLAVRWHDPALTKVVLRVGVVLLGLRLSLAELADLGLRGGAVVIGVVAITFTTTWLLGRRMGLEPGLVVLVAAGFSVCGAAAIAAVESGVRRRPADVAVSIALVTVFGTAMIPLLPLAAAGLGLDQVQAGVWAGASIHEVAQVVAAASLTGSTALAAATTIKLARVALLGAVFVVSRKLAGTDEEDAGRAPLVPWFVWGFLGAVALRTTGLLPGSVLGAADLVTTMALAAAMFGLGMTVTAAALRLADRRAITLALLSTLVAAGTSLALVLVLF